VAWIWRYHLIVNNALRTECCTNGHETFACYRIVGRRFLHKKLRYESRVPKSWLSVSVIREALDPIAALWSRGATQNRQTSAYTSSVRGAGGHSESVEAPQSITDPRILSWWTETDLRTDSLHQSDAPLGLTWCSWLRTCAHAAWKSTSAPLLFCTSGEETVENLKISRGQLAPCQEKRIKQRQAVSSAQCKVLA